PPIQRGMIVLLPARRLIQERRRGGARNPLEKTPRRELVGLAKALTGDQFQPGDRLLLEARTSDRQPIAPNRQKSQSKGALPIGSRREGRASLVVGELDRRVWDRRAARVRDVSMERRRRNLRARDLGYKRRRE